MKKKQKGVSIIVCCHNSEKLLAETIEHLARQKVPSKIRWQVLIINNGSTDNTTAVAEDQINKTGQHIDICLIDEPKLGKNNALETGVTQSTYEYLLVCDDDNRLAHDYVAGMFNIMEKHPEVGMAGGLGNAEIEGEKPLWFDRYQGTYATGPQAAQTGYVSRERNYLYGAGSCIRWSALYKLEQAGHENLLQGPAGGRLSGGSEDIELCYAIVMAGYQLWYEEALCFSHYLPKERMTRDYLIKMTKNTARSYPLLNAYRLVLSEEINERMGNKAIRNVLTSKIWNDVQTLPKAFARNVRSTLTGRNNDSDVNFSRLLTRTKTSLAQLNSQRIIIDKVMAFKKKVNQQP